MVLLIVLRLISSPKDTLRSLVWTMVTPFPPLPNWPLFDSFYLWLLCIIGLFINWTSRMPSYMVILRKKSIWNNLQVLLLRGSLLALFVIFINLCMVLSNLLTLGLVDSPLWFNSLVWFEVKPATIVFYHHTAQGCIYLIMYIDEIVITGIDSHSIMQVKQYLCHHFQQGS